jgi:hypothetical protein
MKSPINATIDYEVGAASIPYRSFEPDESTRMERVTFGVRVEFSVRGDLLGIELLALDDAALAVAREFATKNDLTFPVNRHSRVGQD